MGKSGAFLEVKRKDPGYRDVAARVKDFSPVEQRLGSAELSRQASRCMECGTPFCHAAGCPLGNVIPEINDLVYRGRWQEALDVLLSTNNFPEFTGRICPALCEAACVLGIGDEPVTIRQIELETIENAYARGLMKPRPPSGRIGKKVAVVGSGPAGLAAADCLNKAGVDVTVYDREKHVGGVLRYGIPDFKLDKAVIDRRVRLMQEEGVVFDLGVTVGDDISYNYLRNRYDAVCLTGGSREPRDLSVPGRELAGVHFAMTYLMAQNRLNSGETVPDAAALNAAGKTVVVIGGGDTGSDCVGTAIRQGAKAVVQMEILPRPPEKRPDSTPWPQWPNVLRTSSSHKEGGERRWGVRTMRFNGRDGRVASLSGVEVDWKKGADGRMDCLDRSGTEFEQPADLVLLAMGFAGPGRNKLVEDLGIDKDARGNIKVDRRHMTNSRGVFSAGDMSRGQSLVVRAIADGREAAAGILDYLVNG